MGFIACLMALVLGIIIGNYKLHLTAQKTFLDWLSVKLADRDKRMENGNDN